MMRMYRRRFGHYPNLLFPRTFTEKMQVAKLTWCSPLRPLFIDKIEAKQFVAQHFGADLVTPSLYAGYRLPPREAVVTPFRPSSPATCYSSDSHREPECALPRLFSPWP